MRTKTVNVPGWAAILIVAFFFGLGFMFGYESPPRGDANRDGAVDLADAVYIVNKTLK